MNVPRRCREDGFALPVTIFVITIVTLMITGLLIRVETDRRIAESSGDMVDALTVAQSGLQRYLGLATARPANGDSIRINVQGGYADVVVHRVFAPADTARMGLYVVRSTGHVIKPTEGSDPQASRTVAQFAGWQTGHIGVLGAYTSTTKVTQAGGDTVDITGTDACGTAAPVYGVRAINGSSLGTGITGSPSAYLISGSSGAVAAATKINWDGVLHGGFRPDYTSFHAWDSSYPSMIVNGNLTMQDNGGYGLLIVSGDLTLGGSYAYWDGVILVGGTISFGATWTYFYGSVTSGLNALLSGGNPSNVQLGAPGKNVRIWYNSCSVSHAMQEFTGLVPISKAWVDDWATY
jgi:hypothetical protein